MLSYVDRIQLAVRDRKAAVRTWETVFGATVTDEGGSKVLNAHRTTVQAGDTLFDFLEPAGDGLVQAFAEQWGEGLYGVAFATPDVQAMAKHLDSQRVSFSPEKDALVLSPDATHGMPAMIVPETAREHAGGVITHVYEVTNPVNDWQDTAALYTRIFGLDPTRFSPINSSAYGYTGTLTLFDPPTRLDRVEITQTAGGGAMDRFFQKRGPSLYMCYAETEDVVAFRERLTAAGVRFAGGENQPADAGFFIHPSSLHGMLMGISRTNYAWVWSGRPELAGAGADQFVH